MQCFHAMSDSDTNPYIVSLTPNHTAPGEVTKIVAHNKKEAEEKWDAMVAELEALGYRNIHTHVGGWGPRGWLDWATGKQKLMKDLNELWRNRCGYWTKMIQNIVDHVEASQQDTPVGRKVLKEQTQRERILYEFESVNTLHSSIYGLAQADYAWKQKKWNEVFETNAMQMFCKQQAYKIAQLYTMTYYGKEIVAYDVMFKRMQPIFKAELTVGLSKIQNACANQDNTNPYPEQWLSQLAISNEFYYAFEQESLYPLLNKMGFLKHIRHDQQKMILHRLEELLDKENIEGKTVLSEICDFLNDELDE